MADHPNPTPVESNEPRPAPPNGDDLAIFQPKPTGGTDAPASPAEFERVERWEPEAPVSTVAEPVPDAPPAPVVARPGLVERLANPRALLAILGGALALAAFAYMLVAGEDALVRGLWVAGMAVLILSQASWPRAARVDWRPLAVLALILLAAGYLRLFRLGEVPDDYHGDIASQGQEARDFLQGRQQYLFRTGWSDIPEFDFWQMAVTMRLFGDNLFGLSMSAAIHGLLTILGVYLLARELFDRRVGLLAAALLAISYTHIHFSRLVTTGPSLTFMAFTFFFMVRGLRGRGPLSFLLAGICCGLGLQVYYPARMMGVIIVLLLPWLLLWQREVLRRHLAGIGWMVLGGFASFGPFFAYALQNPNQLVGRGSLVTVFNPTVIEHLKSKYGVATALDAVLENIRRSLLVFSAVGDASTHFGLQQPMVDLATACLLMLGIGLALREVRQGRWFLLLVWLFGTLTLGSIITNDPPFWPHLVVLLIPVVILAAAALERIWQVVQDALGAPGYRIGGVLIVGLIIYVGLSNWDLYYEAERANAQPRARLGRVVAAALPEQTVVLIPDPYHLADREVTFMARGHQAMELSADIVRGDGAPPISDALYVVTPNHADALDALKARYPDALVKDYRAPDGAVFFTTLQVGALTVASAPLPSATPQTGSTPAPVAPVFDFQPRFRYTGNTNSSPVDVEVGRVQVTGGQLTLRVGPLAGHTAAYDYIRLVAVSDGTERRFEAEDTQYTTGDPAYAGQEMTDGHWWQQAFGAFSNQQALLAQRDEGAPILITTVPVPDGDYILFVGTFTGDKDNGVFALGVDY